MKSLRKLLKVALLINNEFMTQTQRHLTLESVLLLCVTTSSQKQEDTKCHKKADINGRISIGQVERNQSEIVLQ